jgi:murein DD-endopeptidase MepM/ murein hydrolase activator NlpD
MNSSGNNQPKFPMYIILPIAGTLILLTGVFIGMMLVSVLAAFMPGALGGDLPVSSAFFSSPSAAVVPTFWKPVLGADAYTSDGVYLSLGSTAHKGVDEFAIDYSYRTEGMDIYPALPGRVVYSGCHYEDYGCTVVVRHWDEKKWDTIYYSIYAHVKEEGMSPLGTLVDGTRPIARMGKTGKGSNGNIHLHFAVRTCDKVYDGDIALYGKIGQTPVMNSFKVQSYLR